MQSIRPPLTHVQGGLLLSVDDGDLGTEFHFPPRKNHSGSGGVDQRAFSYLLLLPVLGQDMGHELQWSLTLGRSKDLNQLL